MERSESIGNLAASLAKARASFRTISKDRAAKITSTKGSFSYSYADLATVVDATSSALAENEIAILQPASLSGGHVVVTTVLAHSSGEWVSEMMEWPVVATDNRSIGSGITYARRHSLLAMVAAAATDEDDDAEAARGGDRPMARHEEDHREPQPDTEIVARLEASIAIEAGKGVEALMQLAEQMRSLPEGEAKSRLRRVYADAWKTASTRRDQAPSTSESSEEQTSPSGASSIPDQPTSTTGLGETTSKTQSPSELPSGDAATSPNPPASPARSAAEPDKRRAAPTGDTSKARGRRSAPPPSRPAPVGPPPGVPQGGPTVVLDHADELAMQELELNAKDLADNPGSLAWFEASLAPLPACQRKTRLVARLAEVRAAIAAEQEAADAAAEQQP